jgi:ATP-dependent Clp protease ATP-binding subunit ClpA
MGERPVTSRGVRVLESATHAAAELGDATVDARHVLIGLASVHEGIAARMLAEQGVTAERALEAARRMHD